jgi:hypothetical protein
MAGTTEPAAATTSETTGRPVRYAEVSEHLVCDTPLRAKTDPGSRMGHIWPGTQRANLARTGAKGRGGGSAWHIPRWFGLSRAELRAALRGGQGGARVREVLLRINPGQTMLFTAVWHIVL